MNLEKCLKVYIFNKNNKYVDWILIDQEAEQIASIIARASINNKIQITNLIDAPILDTFGNFINQCNDKKLFYEIMDYLLPMQMGDINPYSIEIDFTTADDTDNETIKELIKEHCDYIL